MGKLLEKKCGTFNNLFISPSLAFYFNLFLSIINQSLIITFRVISSSGLNEKIYTTKVDRSKYIYLYIYIYIYLFFFFLSDKFQNNFSFDRRSKEIYSKARADRHSNVRSIAQRCIGLLFHRWHSLLLLGFFVTDLLSMRVN